MEAGRGAEFSQSKEESTRLGRMLGRKRIYLVLCNSRDLSRRYKGSLVSIEGIFFLRCKKR
jgi:hypothetical protein